MIDDERQAQMIISRWIHKVTGTSEAERGMRVIGEAFPHFAAAFEKVLAPMYDITTQEEP